MHIKRRSGNVIIYWFTSPKKQQPPKMLVGSAVGFIVLKESLSSFSCANPNPDPTPYPSSPAYAEWGGSNVIDLTLQL